MSFDRSLTTFGLALAGAVGLSMSLCGGSLLLVKVFSPRPGEQGYGSLMIFFMAVEVAFVIGGAVICRHAWNEFKRDRSSQR